MVGWNHRLPVRLIQPGRAMEPKDPNVIKKHNRTARPPRGALILWAGLSALLSIWASRGLHMDRGLLGGLFIGVLFSLFFIGVPLMLGGLYLCCSKLLRMGMRRPAG